MRENSEKSAASPRLCAHDAQQALELEIAMGFKTILVPIEQHDLMNSTLETALLLARKFDSYIEGFALRVAIPAAFALGDVGPLPIPALEQEVAENEKRSRSLFENFMQEHGVPCGGDTKALSGARSRWRSTRSRSLSGNRWPALLASSWLAREPSAFLLVFMGDVLIEGAPLGHQAGAPEVPTIRLNIWRRPK